jgi:hypothetical protein
MREKDVFFVLPARQPASTWAHLRERFSTWHRLLHSVFFYLCVASFYAFQDDLSRAGARVILWRVGREVGARRAVRR